jgi:DNA repair exonuclease SbcCD nuclease subunit
MKIAFFSDVHIANHKRLNDIPFFEDAAISGINVRCAVACGVLDRALTAALANNCDEVFIEGDLFDGARPEPPVIAHVMRILEAHEDLNINILLGNHEQVILDTGNHALGPLAFLKNVRISTKCNSIDLTDAEVWQIPFRDIVDFEASLADMFTGGKKKEKSFRILGCHLGIWDSQTPAWGHAGTDAIAIERLIELCKKYQINAVMAGHWHRHVRWQPVGGIHIVQMGCLCPTDWRDAFANNEVGKIIIVDTHNNLARGFLAGDSLRIDTIEIAGPRFVSCEKTGDLELTNLISLSEKHNFVFARAIGTEENGGMRAVSEWLNTLKEDKTILGGEVLPDNQANQIQARTAATLARCETRLAESLAVFVKNMPMEEGVNRDKVLALSKKYLKL